MGREGTAGGGGDVGGGLLKSLTSQRIRGEVLDCCPALAPEVAGVASRWRLACWALLQSLRGAGAEVTLELIDHAGERCDADMLHAQSILQAQHSLDALKPYIEGKLISRDEWDHDAGVAGDEVERAVVGWRGVHAVWSAGWLDLLVGS